jgi:methylmalonyl-CoA mutase N-terminal domain/subunit
LGRDKKIHIKKARKLPPDAKDLEPLYGPGSSLREGYLNDLNFPGRFPYTRGTQPTMYRGRLWTMRQYAGFGTAEESNKRYRYLLEQGQTGLSVAFDLPTQIGLDSDHELAQGEVGKVGVAIDSIEDMETLFTKIPLDKVSTSMTINAPASILLLMYAAVAEGRGVGQDKLRGTIQNDILKEYIARGTYIFPPAPSLRLVTDSFDYCSKNLPLWNTINVSGYHIREAGSTAIQEVAFTLANGITYVEAAIKKGLDVDNFGRRLAFFFNSHNNLLEEVAKFRAARRMWANIMKHRFGATNERAMQLRFHTQTAGCTLTAQQPENNVIRVTLQALAAVLGGTQSLHTNSMDEAYALPTENAVRIALRTQQIIAHESGTVNTIDPLGGSYFVEWLTEHIEEEAASYINKIDSMGGMLKAIERGWVQNEIAEAAYRYQKETDAKDRLIVGVNQFIQEETEPIPILRVDPKVERKQLAGLKRLKKKRDSGKTNATLGRLQKGAEGDDNLLPLLLDCIRAKATIGEICGVLKSVFGEYSAKERL